MEKSKTDNRAERLMLASALSLGIGSLELGFPSIEPVFLLVMASAAVMSLWKPRLWTAWLVIFGLGSPVCTWIDSWSRGQGIDFTNQALWLDFVPAIAGALAGRLASGVVEKKRDGAADRA